VGGYFKDFKTRYKEYCTFFRTINEKKFFSRPNWTQIQSYTNVESIKK